MSGGMDPFFEAGFSEAQSAAAIVLMAFYQATELAAAKVLDPDAQIPQSIPQPPPNVHPATWWARRVLGYLADCGFQPDGWEDEFSFTGLGAS